MSSNALSEALMAAYELLRLYRPHEPIGDEAHESLLRTLKSCSALAEQFERFSRARKATLTSTHIEDTNVVLFPGVSRNSKLLKKGIDHDT